MGLMLCGFLEKMVCSVIYTSVIFLLLLYEKCYLKSSASLASWIIKLSNNPLCCNCLKTSSVQIHVISFLSNIIPRNVSKYEDSANKNVSG